MFFILNVLIYSLECYVKSFPLNIFLFQSKCLVLYRIKIVMASKQYNEQEVVEKQCLCSEMGMKIPRYVC
jgi:hypothetical protein